jgi:transaldolase/glucose-6-phosphate isomerase
MTTTVAAANPLRSLEEHGQSVWLDYIRRDLITSGELARLVAEDGLKGVTSNPSIFEQAIAASDQYADLLDAPGSDRDPKAVYERIAIRDVQGAADVLAGAYDASACRDGYVSLEVSPMLAHDLDGTLAEAHRLWRAVDRPNTMIKVPATPAGIAALRRLVADGVNVNMTLLFAVTAYRAVTEAWLAGLEDRAARGGDLRSVASVASVFISRIDTAVEAATAGLPIAPILAGRVAIANAKLAYRHFQDMMAGARWAGLAARGAQPQRLLWASTGTKRSGARDVVYVEGLIGPDTVTTLPPLTLQAFRDHGQVRQSLSQDVDAARDTLDALDDTGVSLDALTARLLHDGLTQFTDAFARLLEATATRIERRHRARP